VTTYTEVLDDHGELRLYTKGRWVEWAQDLLQRWGWNIGPTGIDGLFGTWTQAAVMAFQRDKGMTDHGVVDAETWKALEAAKIVFHTYPTVNGNDVEWTIWNDGFTVYPGTKSAGYFMVYRRDRSYTVVGPEERVPLGVDLAAGDTFDARADLLRMSPLDGEFTAQIRIKLDLATVDYDVVNGAVVAAGTFAAQGPQAPPANPKPNLRMHSELSLSGTKILWDVRNAGHEALYANEEVGHVEVWSGLTTIFRSPMLLAPYDIYSLDVRRFEFDLATAGLPNGPLTAQVELTSLDGDILDFEHAGGRFSVP
jgi:hypothetical protein